MVRRQNDVRKTRKTTLPRWYVVRPQSTDTNTIRWYIFLLESSEGVFFFQLEIFFVIVGCDSFEKNTPWFWKKHPNEIPNIQNNREYIQNHPSVDKKSGNIQQKSMTFQLPIWTSPWKTSPPSESWRNCPPGSVAMYPTSVATPRRLDFDTKRCWNKLRYTKPGLQKNYKVGFLWWYYGWGDLMMVMLWLMSLFCDEKKVILWMRWCDDADVNLMSRFLLMFIGDVLDIYLFCDYVGWCKGWGGMMMLMIGCGFTWWSNRNDDILYI